MHLCMGAEHAAPTPTASMARARRFLRAVLQLRRSGNLAYISGRRQNCTWKDVFPSQNRKQMRALRAQALHGNLASRRKISAPPLQNCYCIAFMTATLPQREYPTSRSASQQRLGRPISAKLWKLSAVLCNGANASQKSSAKGVCATHMCALLVISRKAANVKLYFHI